MFRWRTPFVTALSSAEIAPFSAESDSSVFEPSDIISAMVRTRLRVNDRVDRFRSALRFCARKVLAAGI